MSDLPLPLLLLPLCPLFAPALPAQGLDDHVARWAFDDGAGTMVRDSGPNGFHGTLPAGGTWIPGLLGGALELDGLGQSVEVTDGNRYPDLLAGLAEGTISVFFRVDSAPPVNEIHPLLYLGDGVGGTGNSGLILEVGHFGTSTKVYFTVFDDNGHIPQCFDTGFDVTIGDWHQFAVVVGPGFNTGYLDGVELVNRHYNFGGMAGDAFFATVLDPQVMWLGRGMFAYFQTDQWLHGALDELRIWDRPLSAAEIAQHYFDVTGGAGVQVSVQSPPDCGSLVAGTALPWTNPAAPPRLTLPPAPTTVHVEIIGHGGNLGYDDELQALLDADPPGGYQYLVTNRSILGEELWRWVTPGEAGYQAVEDLLNNLQGPTIVLALVTNEAAFPAAVPGLADPNYARLPASAASSPTTCATAAPASTRSGSRPTA
ncbi:MAG: LamG domain-containing protein [Planctomycetes bacterium]|nr:LamG domain-containing protein [Planctomycetota bacterium]